MDHTSTAQSCASGQQSTQLPGSAAQQQGQNNIDTLIQNALQAGVPPQQLLQLLQSNLQGGHAASTSPASLVPGAAVAAAAQQAASIQQQHLQHHQQQQQHSTAHANNNGNGNGNNNSNSTHSNYHNLNAFQQNLVAQHQVAAAAAAAAQQHQTSSAATPQPHQQQQQQHQLANAHSAAVVQQQHHQQLVQQAAAVAAAAAHNQQAHTPTQHQQLQQLAAVAAAAANGAGGVTTPAASQQTQAATAAGTTVPSLAWPIFQPTVSIPFFDMATYQKVNLDVQPSSMANGMDLPLNDINTLRFFFNFGVQHARAILLRQHIQSQSGQNQPQQQLALLQAAQNAAAMATAAAAQQQQQQQQQNQQAQQHQQHQHDQYLLQQNLLKAQNEFNPSGGGASSTQTNTAVQKTSVSGTSGSGGSANVAAAAAVAAFQRDMTSSMSINALQNTLAHQMVAKIGGANQPQVHHSSAIGFKPLVGGGGSDHLETLWLQNALMGSGAGGSLAAQLRSHPSLQAGPHLQSAFGGANAAAAVQQLFLQQQQQLAAAHAAQQQQTQTSISDSAELIRPQAINPLNSAASIASSLHASNALNSSGGLYSTAGGYAVATSASQAINSSSSPKPPIPVDPAPRKSSIIPQAFQAQLGDIKQKGLTALRSPEAMNENLQKSIVAMAAAMNVSLNVPLSGPATTGNKSPASGSAVGINVTSSPKRSPSATAANGPTDMSSQAATSQQSVSISSGGNLSLATQLVMLTGHNWPAHSVASSGNSAAGGATRSLTSGTSGILSHSPGQQTSGQEQQQQLNVLNMLAQHHQQQQEQQHAVTTGILAPELENAPNLLAATEMHYTETFKRAQGAAAYNKKNASPRPSANPAHLIAANMSSAEAQRQRKSGVYMLSMDSKEEDGQKKRASVQSMEKPVSTTVMMNYMNNVLTTAKAQLQSQGMGLCFDESGRPIDFSSRPIDPIFRKAREHLDHQRDYTRLVAESANTMSNASSDSSVQDGSTTNIGGDLGLLSRTSGCLIGISAERLKSLSTAAVSSITSGLAFSPITASSHSEHDRPGSHANSSAIKSGANTASCSTIASSSNTLAVGIAKSSLKPSSSQGRAPKRKFAQEETNQVAVDSQNDTEENLNVEELSPPASNKARSNINNVTTSTMSGFSGLTSSALLAAALQKQQNIAAAQGANSSNDFDNLDVVATEACTEERDLVEVVDSGKVARSIEAAEVSSSEQSKNEGHSKKTAEKVSASTSSPTIDHPVDEMDDEDSSPGGKRLRIASLSSVDEGDV